MSTTKTPATKATATSTTSTKTATTKAPAKAAAATTKEKVKAATVKVEKVKAVKATKAEKAPVEKKERKSRKGITRTFAEAVTASVNPVMAVVNAFITNPETSEDALKMIRLELRKSVKATRGTIKGRKVASK